MSLLHLPIPHNIFQIPRVLFTCAGNPFAEAVIKALATYQPQNGRVLVPQDYRVFSDEAEVQEYFRGGVSPSAAVALFDDNGYRGCFTHLTRSRERNRKLIPLWSNGALWAIACHGKKSQNATAFAERVVRQVIADYNWRFLSQVNKQEFPWGKPRKKEQAGGQTVLPEHTSSIVHALNAGPNLAEAIAHTSYGTLLPRGSRISWYRVVPDPVRCDSDTLAQTVDILGRFEEACAVFTKRHPHESQMILAGADLGNDVRAERLYLDPPSLRFSIDRPDLHYTGDGLFASEIDEMPGGFPELVHLDRAYGGINRARWEQCFSWLFKEGPVLFLISDRWSKPYLPEMRWLCEELVTMGYPARILTTSEMDRIRIGSDGVYLDDTYIGTIWRQFPIFETTGKLLDLVQVAREGTVRMVPEFAHFGNKAWFSLFWSHQEFFRQCLSSDDMENLRSLLPDSRLVLSQKSFPLTTAGVTFRSVEDLLSLEERVRDRLVLKICGANTLAARSYGVLMGVGLEEQVWHSWITDRLQNGQPFIVQERRDTAVSRIAVLNTRDETPEVFPCRILLRPWVANGRIVSVHGCAVPSDTLRVHGRVDMAILPFDLEDPSLAVAQAG